jgi:hypothetical protein
MAKKRKKVTGGYNETGNPGSDQYLSPSHAYTGDGRTTRSMHDRIISVIFRTDRGKEIGRGHGND